MKYKQKVIIFLKYKFINVIGMMTGTSLDGIDISLIKTNGEKILRSNKNFYYKYDNKIKDYFLETINGYQI